MSSKNKPEFLPKFSKRDVFAHMNNRINFLTRLKDITDGFKAKQTLIDARAKNIHNQQMLNYQGEYDRIIHALNHSAIRGLNREMLRERRKELQDLTKDSINPLR